MRKENRSTKAFKQAFTDLIKVMPLEKITVSMICQKADYTRSAFYARFSSIDDFYQIIVDDEIANYMDISRKAYMPGKDLSESYPCESLVELFEYVYSRKELYSFIFTNYNYYNTVERFYTITLNSSRDFHVEFTDSYPAMDQELYVFLSSYVNKGAIKFWVDQNFAWSPKYMAEQCSLFYHKCCGNIKYDPTGTKKA